MSPLCVFLCRDEQHFKRMLDMTVDAVYHRCFVLSTRDIDRRKFVTKDTDNFVSYEYNLQNLDSLSRLITCYSHPMYSHILIFLNDNIDFMFHKNLFSNKEYFINQDCLGFTRQYVALNGFSFKAVKKEPQDPMEYVINIRKALDGEQVSEKYFLEALIELLPSCNYEFDNSAGYLPENYKNIFKSFVKPSDTKYKIYYESNPENKKNTIIFTYSKLDSYKYVVRQDDGLSCYIF